MLYFCLVNSQINYGLLSWGFQYKRLEKLQKRIIRIITCSKYNAHTDHLFKRVNVLKNNDVFKPNALKFYYKYTNNELPSYSCRFQLTRQGSGHPYDTRHGDLIRTRTRINFVYPCLRNHLPSLINSTPPNIMSKIPTHSRHGFSIYVKKVTISNYPQNCEITNCYICHRSWSWKKIWSIKILHSNVCAKARIKFNTSVSHMQVWAYVHGHVRANLHACRQMSLYAYVLIACIYVRSGKISLKLLFTPVTCYISYISVTYSSGGPCASGQEP